MSRERRTNDFLVGITVIVVAIALVSTVLWLEQADLAGRPRRLAVRARDVGGVSLGHPVMIRGVRSGRVEGIALGDGGWVVLTLGIERGVELPADPVVLLTASSLFGEWQATVTDASGVPPDRELRAALAEARTAGDTLPGATLPDIAQLTSVAGRIAGDVAEVADRVRTVFDTAAALELRQTIRDVSAISSELSRTVAQQARNLDRVSVDVQRGVADVARAAETVERIAGRVDSAMSEAQLRQLVANAQRAAEELATTTARLRELAAAVDRTQERVATVVARTDSVVAKVNAGSGSLGLLVNDPRLYQRSDSLIAELRALVADVRANPRRYLGIRIF
jgi:phospholipid/cholesterol/gamma-HCH transport system substrate-binding protein